MRTRYWILGVMLFLAAACGRSQSREHKAGQVAYINDTLLEKIWVSEPVLKVPESVLYDGARNVIYVSNIEGKPAEHDGRGFIARLGPDGKVLQREWVSGLDAPKGLGLHAGRLYVSDINALVVIDVAAARVVARYEAPEAVFLNDVAVASDGTVYVSDMGASAVYRLQGDRFERWLHDARLNGPNGLFVENGALLAGLKDRIVRIDTARRTITDLVLHTGSIDGLEGDGRGGYLISDWRGHVYRVTPQGEKVLLLDTTPIHMQAADIDYVPSSATLLVPTFNSNRIVAYRVKWGDR